MNRRWFATIAMMLLTGCGGEERERAPVPFADDMVLVPTGPFEAGCDPAQEIAVAAGFTPIRHPCTPELHRVHPRRVIELPAFEIDRLEVTVGAYLRCWYGGPCRDQSVKAAPMVQWELQLAGISNEGDLLERLLLPMEDVRPNAARAYCEWVGKRLPTELEWEKAARGTDFRPYPWGTEPPTCDRAVYSHANRETCPLKWYRGVNVAQPVGSRPHGASPYGVLDMIGNVQEITEPAIEDLEGEDAVVRGAFPDLGSMSDMQVFLRFPIERDDHGKGLGFRCARSLPAEAVEGK